MRSVLALISDWMMESYELHQQSMPNHRNRLLALMCGTERAKELLLLGAALASSGAMLGSEAMGVRRNAFERCVNRERARRGIERTTHTAHTARKIRASRGAATEPDLDKFRYLLKHFLLPIATKRYLLPRVYDGVAGRAGN